MIKIIHLSLLERHQFALNVVIRIQAIMICFAEDADKLTIIKTEGRKGNEKFVGIRRKRKRNVE